MENETAAEHFHVALVGPENNGKSILGTTAPGVKLFFDYDQKKQALAGKKDTYAITFKDPGWPKMPEAAEEILDMLNGLESCWFDLSQLKDKRNQLVFPELQGKKTIVENVMHDSMASLGRILMTHELYHSPELRRSLKIGPNMEVHTPRGFDAWNAEMAGVVQIVLRTFSWPVNVFCMFHEQDEESPDSTAEKPKFTGRISVYPVRYRNLLIKYFTDIWRVKLTQVGGVTIPRVYVKPDWKFDSGTAMLLDPIEEPNIEEMIRKHKSRLAGGDGSAPRPAAKPLGPVAGVVKS